MSVKGLAAQVPRPQGNTVQKLLFVHSWRRNRHEQQQCETVISIAEYSHRSVCMLLLLMILLFYKYIQVWRGEGGGGTEREGGTGAVVLQ